MRVSTFYSGLLALTTSVLAKVPSHNFVGATGVGVSDLQNSTDFYQQLLGYIPITTLKTPEYEETIMYDARVRPPTESNPVTSAALVLMKWSSPEKNAAVKNQPIKLVFYVEDIDEAFVQLGEGENKIGGKIISAPGPKPAKGTADTRIGFASDPDGTLLEIQTITGFLKIVETLTTGTVSYGDPNPLVSGADPEGGEIVSEGSSEPDPEPEVDNVRRLGRLW